MDAQLTEQEIDTAIAKVLASLPENERRVVVRQALLLNLHLGLPLIECFQIVAKVGMWRVKNNV